MCSVVVTKPNHGKSSRQAPCASLEQFPQPQQAQAASVHTLGTYFGFSSSSTCASSLSFALILVVRSKERSIHMHRGTKVGSQERTQGEQSLGSAHLAKFKNIWLGFQTRADRLQIG